MMLALLMIQAEVIGAGRIDDAISTGRGRRCCPRSWRRFCPEHPAVTDCAVFGVADDRLGQRVVAAIVVTEPAPTLGELRDFVAVSLDRTAAPRELHVVTELPRHGIGKLNRRALAQRFGPDPFRRIWLGSQS